MEKGQIKHNFYRIPSASGIKNTGISGRRVKRQRGDKIRKTG